MNAFFSEPVAVAVSSDGLAACFMGLASSSVISLVCCGIPSPCITYNLTIDVSNPSDLEIGVEVDFVSNLPAYVVCWTAGASSTTLAMIQTSRVGYGCAFTNFSTGLYQVVQNQAGTTFTVERLTLSLSSTTATTQFSISVLNNSTRVQFESLLRMPSNSFSEGRVVPSSTGLTLTVGNGPTYCFLTQNSSYLNDPPIITCGRANTAFFPDLQTPLKSLIGLPPPPGNIAFGYPVGAADALGSFGFASLIFTSSPR
jgi:hypothetical protein